MQVGNEIADLAESFFSTLKTELGLDTIHASHDAATAAIGEYIDDFDNTRRRHSHLGYVSPIECLARAGESRDYLRTARDSDVVTQVLPLLAPRCMLRLPLGPRRPP